MVRLGNILKHLVRSQVKSQARSDILHHIPHDALESLLPHQQLRGALLVTDVAQGPLSVPVAPRYPHAVHARRQRTRPNAGVGGLRDVRHG